MDLVDEGVVKRFDTLDDLVEYTNENDKYFPKENAYEGGLLRKLLREIKTPYHGKKHRGSTGGGRRGRRGRGRKRGGNQGGDTS